MFAATMNDSQGADQLAGGAQGYDIFNPVPDYKVDDPSQGFEINLHFSRERSYQRYSCAFKYISN